MKLLLFIFRLIFLLAIVSCKKDIQNNDIEKHLGKYEDGFIISYNELEQIVKGKLNYEHTTVTCNLTFTGSITRLKDNRLPINISGFNFSSPGEMIFKERSIKIKFNNDTPTYCTRVLDFSNNEIEFFKQ